MPLNLTPLPPSKGGRVKLDEIHADVVEAIDSGFEWCKTNPGRLSTGDAFGDVAKATLFLGECGVTDINAETACKDAAEMFLHQARSYAYQREPRVVVTGNPTAKGEARFRVDLYVEAPETPAEPAEPAEA